MLTAERLGVQQPRLLRRPAEAISSAGTEAAELAASVGLHLDEWQRLALDVALGEAADGTWAAFEVGLVVPRQNGKGSVLEARELAGLFLFGERLILHSAHVFPTAKEAFRRIESLIVNHDHLRKKVRQVRQSNAEVSIELLDGARLRFVARNRNSARGFSGDLVIMDEAFALDGDAMGALLPTLSARPNPQIWYASSAAMASSTQLHAVRRRAVTGESAERLAYLEWSTEGAADDPRSWAEANPALGIRIPLEFVSSERDALPPAMFARERLGVPDEEAGTTVPVIPPAVWAELADPMSEWQGSPVGVVDVSLEGTASIALCGVRADGRRHVELVDHRPGTRWVAERRQELAERWGVHTWTRDPRGPAVELGGEWHDVSTRDVAEACAGFIAAVADGALRWRCAEELERAVVTAVAGAVRAEHADGAWTWSRRRSTGVDISPLVAMTLGWSLAGVAQGSAELALW